LIYRLFNDTLSTSVVMYYYSESMMVMSSDIFRVKAEVTMASFTGSLVQVRKATRSLRQNSLSKCWLFFYL